LPQYEGLMQIVDRVRDLFDLRADPLLIAHYLGLDPGMKRLLDLRPGLRVPGAWDGFELCVRAVLGERLGVTESTATILAGQLTQRFGRPLKNPTHGLTHLFPRPQDLIDADLSRLRTLGNHAHTIRAVALAVAQKKLMFEATNSLEESITRLLAIPGIDRPTAEYIAMRVYGEPDAFPVDLEGNLCRAANSRTPDWPCGILQASESWRPWRAYAALHLVQASIL
jgi:AraC family transcriptional regulator of adaptative response / DNA-3-methyladenine glycosylase II